MRSRGSTRAGALLLVLALVAAACSGSKTDDDVATGERSATPGDRSVPEDDDAGGAAGATPADPEAPGAVEAPEPDLASGSGGTTSGRSGATGAGATGGGSGSGSSGGGGSGTPTGGEVRDADLYSGAANTQGITDTEIRMCGHAALILASAFDTSPRDLNVYWEMVRDQGGIHGRNVSVSWEDDRYSPDQAVQAAERCKAKNPFLMLGGIGFDQIPAVRNWAEENRMLYFHHIAVEAGLEGKRYSFSGLPSVDAIGRAFGEYLVSRHRGEPIGVVWRESENWEPGHRAGMAVLEEHGAEVVADLAVSSGQSVYSQQILELRRQGAEVVWVWENALAAAEMIQQARNQGYEPTWVVFPFQTTLDITGEVDIEGVAAWPAYARGGYPGDPFSDFGYNAEIARFEQAMAKYRPGVRPNDLLWQMWIANKAIHDLLDRCGPDCTRNRLAGIFLSGLRTRVEPNCTVDFGRSSSYGGHLGGFQFYTHEGAEHSAGFVFHTTRWCSERLL